MRGCLCRKPLENVRTPLAASAPREPQSYGIYALLDEFYHPVCGRGKQRPYTIRAGNHWEMYGRRLLRPHRASPNHMGYMPCGMNFTIRFADAASSVPTPFGPETIGECLCHPVCGPDFFPSIAREPKGVAVAPTHPEDMPCGKEIAPTFAAKTEK